MSCPLRQSPGGDSHSPTGGTGILPCSPVLGYLSQVTLSSGQGGSQMQLQLCHNPEQDPELHGGNTENILALQGWPGLSDQSWLLSPQNVASSVPTPAQACLCPC